MGLPPFRARENGGYPMINSGLGGGSADGRERGSPGCDPANEKQRGLLLYRLVGIVIREKNPKPGAVT
jgi:hypothetical protein